MSQILAVTVSCRWYGFPVCMRFIVLSGHWRSVLRCELRLLTSACPCDSCGVLGDTIVVLVAGPQAHGHGG
eukprot:1121211-Prymnesium_polylepis.1